MGVQFSNFQMKSDNTEVVEQLCNSCHFLQFEKKFWKALIPKKTSEK